MTDPFDALRAPLGAAEPDPDFARDLRARVERALLDPGRTIVTTTADTATEAGPAEAVPLHAVTPYLAVPDARAAVEFYVEAFGARRRGEPIVMPDGRTGHVEVALGDSVLMMADEFPEMGLVAPLNRGGVSQSLRLEVGDPDAVVERAVRLGGTLERPVTDSPYGRGGVVVDPAGHRWMISREPAGPAGRTGPIVYASVWTHDVDRAERFYAAVLGWTVTAGSGAQGRQVANRQPRLGLFGGQRSTLMACFAVADVDAAVALVRAAGGTATDPVDEDHGRVADCVDDQGLPFALQRAAGRPVRPPKSRAPASSPTCRCTCRTRRAHGRSTARFWAGGSSPAPARAPGTCAPTAPTAPAPRR